MMKALTHQPLFWLALQAALLSTVFIFHEGFQIQPIDADWYWHTALSTNWSSPTEILSSSRTFAYPLFLECVHKLSPSFAVVPFCHLALRVLAVFAFYRGLRQVRVPSWPAVAAASALLYTDSVIGYPVGSFVTPLSSWLLTDCPGESLMILTVGTLLTVICYPHRAFAWFALTLALFLTWQTRPVYVFLAALLPPLGLLLMGLAGPRAEWVRLRRRVGIGLLAACVLPVLAWCTLRWALVGQFGLCANGGGSLVGIAGQFLTEDLVPELPDDLRPFALAALEKRKQKPMVWSSTADWRAPITSDNRLRAGVTEDIDTAGSTQIHFWDAAFELYGSDPVLVERKNMEVSWAIIKLRPQFFYMWIAEAFKAAVVQVLVRNRLLVWLMPPLALLLIVWFVMRGIYHLRGTVPTPPVQSGQSGDNCSGLKILVPIAVSIVLAKVLMIALFTIPQDRYCYAAGVFLPAVAVLAVIAVWGRIRALVRVSPHRVSGMPLDTVMVHGDPAGLCPDNPASAGCGPVGRYDLPQSLSPAPSVSRFGLPAADGRPGPA